LAKTKDVPLGETFPVESVGHLDRDNNECHKFYAVPSLYCPLLSNGWVNKFHIFAKTDRQAAIEEIIDSDVFCAVLAEVT
jgi:hypothetical protein